MGESWRDHNCKVGGKQGWAEQAVELQYGSKRGSNRSPQNSGPGMAFLRCPEVEQEESDSCITVLTKYSMSAAPWEVLNLKKRSSSMLKEIRGGGSAVSPLQ